MCSAAVSDLKIGYPVAIDNEYAIWRAFDNEYWPAHYFIDAQGRSATIISAKATTTNPSRSSSSFSRKRATRAIPPASVSVKASGAEAAPSRAKSQSPETYIGYNRARRTSSRRAALSKMKSCLRNGNPELDQWSLSGDWTIGQENATLNKQGGRITYRFHARDLHLVLGPAAEGSRSDFA